jgi:hypothetical protein
VLSACCSFPACFKLAGIRFALYSATHKIGFPGWPEPNLDSVTGFGASIEIKGACTSPLFHFRSRFVRPRPATFESVVGPRLPRVAPVSMAGAFFVPKKSERPLGGAAARAWGMEGTVTLSQLGSSGRSAALASSRTTHRSRHVTTSEVLQKSNQLPITCPVCVRGDSRSIARRVHFCQYFSTSPIPSSLVRKYFRPYASFAIPA